MRNLHETEKIVADASPIRTLAKAIRDAITGSKAAAAVQAQEVLVKEEIDRRANLIVAGWRKLRDSERELQRIQRGDIEEFVEAVAEDGTKTMEKAPARFSKARVEEIKKATEKIKRIEDACNLAIDKAEFQKLEEIVAK